MTAAALWVDTSVGPMPQAYVSTAEIRQNCRESHKINDTMHKQCRTEPADSAVVLCHGGLIRSLGLLRGGVLSQSQHPERQRWGKEDKQIHEQLQQWLV